MQERNSGTYSIVAIDKENGEIGVAVQSHWFSVGSVVPWAEPSAGAVATQAFANTLYGYLGLKLMESGLSADKTLSCLLSLDDQREKRQVGMIDSMGNVAVHTGSNCIPFSGHIKGKDYTVQANMMLNSKVWKEIARTFEKSSGKLSERMILALEAGEKAGGDVRGRQSCAVLVVKLVSSNEPWKDRVVDLRVEDSDEPIKEMKRLLRIREAYDHADRGDSYLATGMLERAMSEYKKAFELAPEKEELRYWYGIGLINSGLTDEGIRQLNEVYKSNPRMKKLTKHLPSYGLLKAEKKVISRIV